MPDEQEVERQGKLPRLEREDVAAILTEVRSALLRVMANNHHPDRIVTLPQGVVESLDRAEREVAAACKEMLDDWDTMSADTGPE